VVDGVPVYKAFDPPGGPFIAVGDDNLIKDKILTKIDLGGILTFEDIKNDSKEV